jgi:serine/threonine-protein kinase
MTAQQRWQRVQHLTEQIEMLPASERNDFLSQIESDASIRSEVIALLEGLEQEPNAVSVESVQAKAAMPVQIGPYNITGILGQGGMGIVYAAEADGQPVALKLIQTHLHDADHLIRFEREQKILAKLDHPGIAKMLDAGVSQDQQPYLVMERVDGKPLDQYCDTRTLSTEARIRLLIDVCRAVEGAHRQLIVHLDLKPSNILVTDSGQVKLLDFGTAKLLHADASLTTTRQLTPMYASPEQLRGEGVTTACDIYSLGLILYEQLCGAWPFGSRDSMMSVAARAVGSKDTQPMSKAITEDGAKKRGVRPERLRDQLRGDLEAIVSKALSAAPADRYGSVAELAEDLDQFLKQRPIRAQRQTTIYRAKKYIARNRGALSMTAVVVIGLLSLGGYALWQQRQAAIAGRRAQATAQFLNWMIQSSNPINGGSTTRTVREMIERARPRINKGLQEYPEVFAPLTSTFGDFLVNAGRPEAGVEWQKQAVDQSRQSGSKASLLGALASYVVTLSNSGKCPEALVVEREMKALLLDTESGLSPVELVKVHTAISYPEEACDLNSAASLASMEKAYAASKGIANDSLETDFPPRLFKGVLAVNLATSLRNMKRTNDARVILNEGLALIEKEPDAYTVKVALLRSRSTIEAEEMNYLVSARTLQEILAMAGEALAPIEIVRLHSILAVRLASGEQKAEAIEEAKKTEVEAEKRKEELGVTAYMAYVDVAVATALADDCELSLRYAAKANELTQGQIGNDHRINYDSALGICLVRTGKREEGLKLVQSVIESQKIAENPTRPLSKALRAAQR